MGPKCHHQCPYKSEAEGDLSDTRRGEGLKVLALRIGRIQTKAKTCWQHPWEHLVFRTLASRTAREWVSVAAAMKFVETCYSSHWKLVHREVFMVSSARSLFLWDLLISASFLFLETQLQCHLLREDFPDHWSWGSQVQSDDLYHINCFIFFIIKNVCLLFSLTCLVSYSRT